MISEYDIGTIVEMKKKHPCGSHQWEVIRMGADIKIKCLGYGRMVMLARKKFEKDAKIVTTSLEN